MLIGTQFAPKSFYAGDTVTFSVKRTEYSSSEWDLVFVIAFPTGRLSVQASTEGEGFEVTVPGNRTEKAQPGSYPCFLVFSKDDERVTVQQRGVVIMPNPLRDFSPTEAMELLANVVAAIKTLSRGTNQQISIGSETYTKKDLKTLFDIRDRLRVEVAAERRAMGLPARGGGKKIYTRFTNK
jgi:hypothetical protein